jgi:cytoskeletal protein RodZ
VLVRSIFFSRFFIRCIEVAGAGIVSALCAYFLSQIQLGKPAAAPPQVAQVSSVNQLALAAGESVRVVEEVPAPLVEAAPDAQQPQKDEPPKKPESTAAAPTAPSAPAGTPAPAAAPAPKPAKPAHAVPPRRQQKPEHAPVVEAKPRAPELAQPPVAAAPPAAAPPAQSADAAPAAKSAEDDRPLFARLKLVPSWFSSGSDKPAEKPIERPAAAADEVPRPPMPVGDPLRSAM